MTARNPRPARPDAGDRRRAVTLFDRNLVVTAGAGTGKTSLLVERALNLIGRGLATIDTIAAITFTEKAAAELKERLALGLDRLRHLAGTDAPLPDLDASKEADRSWRWLRGEAGEDPPAVSGRALQALLGLDAAPVSTIHAFCADILRRHPREARVDPSFSVDEGEVLESLFAEEWDRFLEEELGPGGPRGDLWRRALRLPGALDAIRDLARRGASFALPREALLATAGGASDDGRRALRDEARSALVALEDALRRARDFPGTMDRFLRSAVIFLTAFLEGGHAAMAGAAAPFSLAEFAGREVPGTGRRLAGIDPSDLKAVAARAHRLIEGVSRSDDGAIAALVEAAAPLAGRCRERLLASGFVSFDALLRLARDLLADQPAIRRSLAARCRRILVDEFQDTDPLQYDILFFIAASDRGTARDAFRAELEPGRLFIVGDPKQSIYRFRGADIEAYGRAVERIVACGGEVLTLSSSFRSPEAIVAPINRIFAAWIGRAATPEEKACEPAYEPITSAIGREGTDGPRAEIWSVEGGGLVESRRRAEAEAIAGWIAAGGAPSGASIRPGDVAILLRALTSAGPYPEALRRAGIPFIVEGGKHFYDRPEVSDFLSFLRAAANPNDAVAVLAVLRSPLGGATDEELARFVAAGGRLDRPDGGLADPPAHRRVCRTLERLRDFRLAMRGRAPDETVRAALERTPLLLLHAAAFEGAQRVANLRKLAARAEALARQGLSLPETLAAIEENSGGERDEGDSPLADERIDAVRILSVHKAKGLEFPVVIVPDLARESGEREPAGTGAIWVRDGSGGFLAVRLADGTLGSGWVAHREQRRRHESAEEKRVFYVACTRARERLILVNSGVGRTAPWRDALAAVGYDAAEVFPADGALAAGLLRHRRLSPAPVAREAAPAEIDPIWSRAARRFEAAAASAAASATPPLRWPAGAGDAAAAGDGERADGTRSRAPGGPPGDVARAAGIAVHAALEAWDFRDAAPLLDRARIEASSAAAEIGPGFAGGPRFARRVEEEAARILEGFLASPLRARLAGEEILGREVPLALFENDRTIWIGACDLVYRDRDGGIVAADYKTDRKEGDAAAAAARYSGQVGVYVRALRAALPQHRVRGEILFLRTGVAVPIEST